jgi:hypothetical protein
MANTSARQTAEQIRQAVDAWAQHLEERSVIAQLAHNERSARHHLGRRKASRGLRASAKALLQTINAVRIGINRCGGLNFDLEALVSSSIEAGMLIERLGGTFGKLGKKSAAVAHIVALSKEKLTYREIAVRLNSAGQFNRHGEPWTAEAVKKARNRAR